MQITVWNEFLHEQRNPAVAALYPEGIHGAIATGLRAGLPDAEITTATLAAPEHGLPAAVLDATDVLFWWGHLAHHEVADAVGQRGGIPAEMIFDHEGVFVIQSVGWDERRSALLASEIGRALGKAKKAAAAK